MGKGEPHDQGRHHQEKYNTEIYLREKFKYPIGNHYNTTPNDKYANNLKKRPDPQFDYIKHNLFIKSCLGGERDLPLFQTKKVSIRNYTPKILNQEMNMGMWM